jgi:hypothetical protein
MWFDGMTFHGNVIAHWTCNIVVIIYKRLITISKPRGAQRLKEINGTPKGF